MNCNSFVPWQLTTAFGPGLPFLYPRFQSVYTRMLILLPGPVLVPRTTGLRTAPPAQGEESIRKARDKALVAMLAFRIVRPTRPPGAETGDQERCHGPHDVAPDALR